MLEQATTVEMVRYTLKEGIASATGEEARKNLNAFIQKHPGFLHRVTSVDNEGVYLDLVFWKSLKEAQAASELALKTPEVAQQFAVIDESSMLFGHSAVFNYC